MYILNLFYQECNLIIIVTWVFLHCNFHIKVYWEEQPMADTNDLKKITEYAIRRISDDLSVTLITRKIPVGSQGRLKEFDGVSADSSVVVQIINHGGYTSGGKLPSAKIKNTYADCYFLNLTHAKRKILAITNQEFFSIFKDKSQGFLNDIEVLFIDLSDELKEMAKKVIKSASEEMAKE